MKEKVITTDSGSVHYWLSDCFDNDKPTLFFLHGMTGDHSMFQEQTEYFFDKYNLVLWDAPAHGKSRPFEDFTYEKAANIITTSTVTYDEDKSSFQESHFFENRKQIIGINIYNIWFEIWICIICMIYIQYMFRLLREDTIITFKVRMDN